ncbi:pirin family protein [Massilia sp. R2A-15]|uniref:pirin family protein n=1 Tax=Massilia sp. R2A-15 TaxID=3064278 RepID=UPI0027355980|nr:pirin family protein [Massilia sp. R2A-15]WLI90933.1 pirin family protein [Massilia sp. R2A-15]
MAIEYFFKPHEKDLGGGFMVRRILPAAAKQAVGPFIFFDHFGPIDAPPDANHDVRPHPHIGLATVTYLFEGAMLHRDSLGSVQRIEPGAINWMTAGSGIVHSERTPPDLVGKARRSHGLQLWAALPKEHEEGPPGFSHTAADQIPVAPFDGGVARVLIGSAFGLTSPVATFSETLYLDIRLDAGAELVLDKLPEEAAIYPVAGELAIDGEALAPHTMAYFETGGRPRITTATGVQFVVIGGAPLDGHRFLFWNFVSSSKERLAQAADDWEQQRYAKVPGETEWISLPRPLR